MSSTNEAVRPRRSSPPVEGTDAASNRFSPLRGVRDLREVGFLTGESSPNRTRTQWGIGGTDLGILFGDGPYLVAFGDTFSSEGDFSTGWRSNTLAIVENPCCDSVPVLSRMICDATGYASEVIPSRKTDDDEKTVIPTGGFQIGDSLYMTFMSVRCWGIPGDWECNASGMVKSVDGGASWTSVASLSWPGDSGFVQQAAHKVGTFVYFWCIPAGRFGSVSLMRVAQDAVEDPAAYEYYLGLSSRGESLFARGEEAMRQASTLLSGPCGELSVAYSPKVGGYLLASYNEVRRAILLQAAPAPEGPYGEPVPLAGAETGFLIYGGFLHSDFTAGDGGQRIGFTLSQWLPTYNIRWMEATLVTGDAPSHDRSEGDPK